MRLLSLALLAACAGSTDPTDVGVTDDPTVTDKKAKDTACVDRTYERAASTPEGQKLPCQKTDDVLGTVRDGAGAPVAGALVNVCQAICLTAITGPDGEFCVEEIPDGWHALEVVPPICSTGMSTALTLVWYEGEESRTFPMAVPDLGDEVAIPSAAAEIEPAPGLFVTVGEGQLSAPFRDEPTAMSGVRLSEDQFPEIDLDGTVIDVWYLAPFEHEADPALPMRFANHRKLTDGTVLQVYNGSYEAQRWLDAGTVTAKGDWLEGDVTLGVTSTVVLMETARAK